MPFYFHYLLITIIIADYYDKTYCFDANNFFFTYFFLVFSYDKLSSLAESLWSRKLPIGADRGEIYDRKGRVLATNLTTTSLVLIPNQIKNPEEVAQKLSEILNSDYDDMLAHVSKNTFYQYLLRTLNHKILKLCLN